MLTDQVLLRMWPNADAAAPGMSNGIAVSAAAVFGKYGLAADLTVAHAMAQFSHECGAGTELVENLNYSAQGLMNTWPGRFDATKAAAFAHDPKRIANEVYNGRMGNQPGTDDGWNFRGRGGSQVTGRENYGKLGQNVGLELLDAPDLVNSPGHFLECAVADFVLCGCLPFAAHDDVGGVTFHLNGGFIGLADRTAWLARWKAALTGEESPEPGTVWLQESLNKLGAEPPLSVDGSFGPATLAAVESFQRGHDLAADGKVGALTMAAIRKALAAAQPLP